MESKVFDPSLMENRFRHEFKYLSTLGQLKTIQVRLTGLIPLDPHVGPDGIYNIRSLYFDDYEDRYLKENEAGVDPREKFRIRIYNHSDSRISLELKRKVAPPVLQKLCLLMRTRLLRPKVIVEYDRVPYIYPQGNVRITLDENIRSSSRVELFLEDQIPTRPILPAGQHILEVKYDEYLPDFIYRAVQLQGLHRTAFSKYYLCRRYHL